MHQAHESALRHLRSLRQALLKLHKALIDSERIAYEKKNGRVRSQGEFLELVTRDPFFAWIHPLTELIVQMDIALDGKDGTDDLVPKYVLRQAKSLVRTTGTKNSFAKKLGVAIQTSPDVVLALGEVSALLESQTVH